LISYCPQIKTYSTTACQPWIVIRVEAQINPHSKEEEAKAHDTQYAVWKQDDHNIFVIQMN
jgi:hypothetical protein